MATATFTIGQRFLWDGNPSRVRQVLSTGKRRVVDESTGEIRDVEQKVLVDGLFEGCIHFLGTKSDAPDTHVSANGTLRSFRELEDYPPHLVKIAKLRELAIAPIIAIDPEKRTRKHYEDRSQEIKAGLVTLPPDDPYASAESPCRQKRRGSRSMEDASSVRSLYVWVAIYEANNRDLRSLIPYTTQRGGGSHLPNKDLIEVIIDDVIEDLYLVPEETTATAIADEVAKRVAEHNESKPDRPLTVPSERTIQRRIDALDQYDVILAKQGEEAAKLAIAQYGQKKYPRLAMAEAEMDSTTANFIVVGEDGVSIGRPTITVCVDVATRYPLGFYIGFQKSSDVSSCGCLYHSIVPKDDVQAKYPGLKHTWLSGGIFAKLRVDNAAEYRSATFRGACDVLKITLEYAPPRVPQAKAIVERLLSTFNEFFHSLPGTTFSNPNERGSYDSAAKACITMADLEYILHIYILDIYAERPHRGLRRRVPARLFSEQTGGLFSPKLPWSADELEVLLGKTEYRTIQHYGITIENLRFNSTELGRLRLALRALKAQMAKTASEEKSEAEKAAKRGAVKVKLLPSDMGEIQVYNPFTHRYFSVPALDQEHARGRTLWQHREIDRTAKGTSGVANAQSRAEARRTIRKVVEEALQKKGTTLSERTRIARLGLDVFPDPETERDLYGEEAESGAPEIPAALPSPAQVTVPASVQALEPAPQGDSVGADADIDDEDDDGFEVEFNLDR